MHQTHLKVDSLVLLILVLPPSKYLIGRITFRHPGPDVVSRDVTVRTADSINKRAGLNLSVILVDDIDAKDNKCK